MDSSSKPNKRSKLPPTNTRQSNKTPKEGPLHNSENRLRAIVSPTLPNRPQSSVSRDKRNKKGSILSTSANLNDVTNTGKENKSQSPPRKKSKSKQNNQSMIQGYVVKKGTSAATSKSRKTSPEKTFLNTSTEKQTKYTKKGSSRQSVSTSVTLHRRYNSSVVGHHSRVQSNERKSITGSRNINNVNSSLLNNSLLENPLDYSREFSYLKEYDTSEFVHNSDIAGLYNSSYSSNVKPAGSNERLNPGFTILHDDNFGTTHIEEEIEQEELSGASTPFSKVNSFVVLEYLLLKGKGLFKQKRYKEAIE